MPTNSGFMDTEAGGEQTQYEGECTDVASPAKEGGQLGGTSGGISLDPSNSASDIGAPNTQGVTPAEKIRYGQSIQEGGMGGKTQDMTGEANTEGGFGGTEALEDKPEGFAKERREQGYGGGRDMDRNVGA